MEHTSVRLLKLFIIADYNFLCSSSSSLTIFLFNYFISCLNNLNLHCSLFMSDKVNRIAKVKKNLSRREKKVT